MSKSQNRLVFIGSLALGCVAASACGELFVRGGTAQEQTDAQVLLGKGYYRGPRVNEGKLLQALEQEGIPKAVRGKAICTVLNESAFFSRAGHDNRVRFEMKTGCTEKGCATKDLLQTVKGELRADFAKALTNGELSDADVDSRAFQFLSDRCDSVRGSDQKIVDWKCKNPIGPWRYFRADGSKLSLQAELDGDMQGAKRLGSVRTDCLKDPNKPSPKQFDYSLGGASEEEVARWWAAFEPYLGGSGFSHNCSRDSGIFQINDFYHVYGPNPSNPGVRNSVAKSTCAGVIPNSEKDASALDDLNVNIRCMKKIVEYTGYSFIDWHGYSLNRVDCDRYNPDTPVIVAGRKLYGFLYFDRSSEGFYTIQHENGSTYRANEKGVIYKVSSRGSEAVEALPEGDVSFTFGKMMADLMPDLKARHPDQFKPK